MHLTNQTIFVVSANFRHSVSGRISVVVRKRIEEQLK